MTTIVDDAIHRSISHTEIVWLDGEDVTPSARDYLIEQCDDSVDAGTVLETWGTTGDGEEWRVHVRTAVETDE